MADYMDLLAQIDANIRRNGAQEITGPILNAVLRLMVTELGSGAVLMGVATTDTRPGTPDGRQAWIAAPGSYPGFGEEVTVPDGTIGVISNISGPWTVQSIPVGKDYSTEVESLQGKVGDADFSGTNYLTKQTDLTGAAKTLDLQVKLAMDEIDTLGASEKNIVNNLLPKKQDKSDPALETEDKSVVGAINELRGAVETLQESSTPTYVLNGLYYAVSANGLHLDDATPYIGSFEELQRAIESGAHIVDYVPAGQDGGESPSASLIPLMAQFVPDQTITLMYTMGQMVQMIKLSNLLDGVEADADPVYLSSVIRYKSTLQFDYLIPSNPTDTEHLHIITVGPTVHQVTWSADIKWQDGLPPEVEADTTLVVSVINNLAVWGTFKKEA